MTAEAYLEETNVAVEGLFGLLAHYDNLTPPPSVAPFVDERGIFVLNRSQAEDYMRTYVDSMALEFSKAMLAGSILQVAHKALKEYSTNSTVSSSAATLGVTESCHQVRFAVGRDVHGIPSGLLVYAGRIQYNHYEDGRPKNRIARAVFDTLLGHYCNDMTFDMAYELEWPAPRPVSHYVVRHELRWFSASDYVADMKDMLAVP